MKNLKIGKKLLITFGTIILFFCIVVVVSIFGLIGNGNRFENFYDNGYKVTNQVMELRRAIQSSGKNIGYSMMVSDKTETANYIQAAKDETETMKACLAFIQKNFQGDQSIVEGFNNSMLGISEAREQVYQLALENQNDEASKVYFEKVLPGYLEAQDYLTKIYDAASASADSNYSDSKAAEKSSVALLSILSAAALITTTLLATYIIKSLTTPILEIEAAAKEMAKGSLNVDITYQSKDELGNLSECMRILVKGISNIVEDIGNVLGEMAKGNFCVDSQAEENYIGDYEPILLAMRNINQSLSSTLSQINQSSDQVSSGSDQVSSGAQALSQGATEQASSIQELAATITEISNQVKKNAESAQTAKTVSSHAGNEIASSNLKMQEMTAAISKISEKSSEIGKIIKTIEDIAFQTNILALNAAVEAARAGAAGKGFAVVADEVRNLAGKSSEAAKNTTVLIEDTIHAVEDGTRIAGETADSMTGVVKGAQQITDLVDEIAAASSEQATAIIQVTQGIDQISSVVQTNSATAEQSAAASEELSGQAQILKNLVGQFRLKERDVVSYSSGNSNLPSFTPAEPATACYGKYE